MINDPSADQSTGYDPEEFLNGNVDEDALVLFDSYADRYIDVVYDSSVPIFNGSYDWHSSVHAHLANVLAYEATGDLEGLKAFVEARFSPLEVQAEIQKNYADPYGWAWLLQLDTRLQDHGITALAPVAEHFATKLIGVANNNAAAPDRGTGLFNTTYGSYGDASWMYASLYQWAQKAGQTALADQARTGFLQFENLQSITAATDISVGDFYSKVGISAYAHVVMGVTDTAMYRTVHDAMLSAVMNGSLAGLLSETASKLASGVGFDHFAGRSLSAAFGYWALFEETGTIGFARAYNQIMELATKYAYALGNGIEAGHWLPNFAAFAAGLPSQLQADTIEGYNVSGGAGNDVLVGDITADTFNGNDGNDSIYGGAGNDTLSGGAGNDRIFGEYGAAPPSSIGMGTGSQTITRSATNNSLATALDITNNFSLSNNANIQRSTVEPHTTVQATGNGKAAFYKVSLNAGATIKADIDAAAPGFNSWLRLLDASGKLLIENNDAGGDPGTTIGSDSALMYTVGAAGVYTIQVGQFLNGFSAVVPDGRTYTLHISVPNPSITQYDGVAGNDILDGGAGDDLLDGGAGNDDLAGGIGTDRVDGGTGDDVIRLGADIAGAGSLSIQLGDGSLQSFSLAGLASTSDTVIGGAGYDKIVLDRAVAAGFVHNTRAAPQTMSGIEEIVGTDGNDIIATALNYTNDAGAFKVFGGAGNDVIGTGALNDEVSGGAGDDLISGLGGDDRLAGDVGADRLDGGAGNDHLDGGADNDVLFGNADRDILLGDAGDDLLDGGAGNDDLNGGVGNDLLDGGEGDDRLDGGADNDRLLGGVGHDVLAGDAGNDDLSGGDGNDVLSGGVDSDILVGDAGDDDLSGGDGDDVLAGGVGNDLLDGGEGHDRLEGGDDNDRLLGGAGRDVLMGDAGDDDLSGGDGDDVLAGGAGSDVLVGDAGDDDLSGGNGDDVLAAGAGNNLLDGGDGDDRLDGGADNDRLLGGAGHDVLVAYAGEDVSNGGAGDDLLDGGDGDDRLDGGADNDTLLGGAGRDILAGGAGNDDLGGGDGDDSLFGDAGNDRIIGGDGNDYAQGGADDDTFVVLASDGRDEYDGGAGNDTIDFSNIAAAINLTLNSGTMTYASDTLISIENVTGGSASDRLTGDALANVLTGNAGDDTLKGEAGDDPLFGGAGNDQLIGGLGNDSLDGGDGDDALKGEDGNDEINGGAGNDQLIGGLGNDSLDGGDGDDTLKGEDGNDMINGGAGNDTLTGGAGSDQFIFNSLADGVDTIKDFSVTGASQDQLAFSTAMFTGFTGDAAFDLVNSGYLRAYANGGATQIQIDVDGSGNNFQTVVTLNGTVTNGALSDHFLLI